MCVKAAIKTRRSAINPGAQPRFESWGDERMAEDHEGEEPPPQKFLQIFLLKWRILVHSER